MPPRFLIDETLSPALARHLPVRLGYDAVHVNEIGLAGQPQTCSERLIAQRVALGLQLGHDNLACLEIGHYIRTNVLE